MIRCVYIFAIGKFFASRLGDTAFARGTLVDISTRGDTAYSDEVVLVNVHNLFFEHIGSFPLFVRWDTASRRGLSSFCSEIPLLSEEF